MRMEHEYYMRLALQEALEARDAGNLGVGCVIVRDREVIARGRNEVTSLSDITAHAEMMAIRTVRATTNDSAASHRATPEPLAGCVLYTTIEPCPMCCWASCLAGLSTIVFGACIAALRDPQYGAYSCESLLALTGKHIMLVSGVLGELCREVRLGQAGTERP